MLRGFRWQFAILVLALILFGAALILRPRLTAPAPTATPASPAEATADAAPVTSPTLIPPAAIEEPVVYREGVVGRLQRLNPLFAALNPVDRDVASLIFEGLVGIDQYGEYVPRLAENWTISSDGLEYVFRLRQDVLWQDGLPFIAADVATTIGFLQAPGDVLPAELTDFWRTVEVELLDENTVRFRLAQPLASFLDRLRIGMLPAHVFNGLAVEQLPTHPFNLAPIGTGPYQLESLQGAGTIDTVNLRVAPVYRQRPEGAQGFALERLTFNLYDSHEEALAALQADEIDGLGGVSQNDILGLEQASAVDTRIGLQPTFGVVLFNWESPNTQAFRDVRVRRGLTQGTDRAALVNRYLTGQAILADSPIMPNSWAYAGNLDWPAYDPAGAAALIADVPFDLPEVEAASETAEGEDAPADETAEESAVEAETTPDAEATSATATPEGAPEETATPEPDSPYDFTLLCLDDATLTALCTDLVAQWNQLGVQVGLETAPLDGLYERLANGEFDTALVELSLSPSADPDPYAFWHQGQYQIGQNYGGVNDRRSSELLESARRDPNGLHRAEYYAQFQQTFLTRSLALLLYYPVYEYAVSAHVDGVQLGYLSTPADRFATIGRWQMIG